MIVEYTKRFKRSYKKMDKDSQELIKEALKMLAENLKHPSLRVKKMQGYHNPYVWEASANMDIRITFEMEKPDKLILRNCGHHNETLSNP